MSTSNASTMAKPMLNTSIQLPPRSELVSPVTLNSAGIGSPTPTPGTEMRSNYFWDNATTKTGAFPTTAGISSPISTTPAGTPGTERHAIFWDSSPSKLQLKPHTTPWEPPPVKTNSTLNVNSLRGSAGAPELRPQPLNSPSKNLPSPPPAQVYPPPLSPGRASGRGPASATGLRSPSASASASAPIPIPTPALAPAPAASPSAATEPKHSFWSTGPKIKDSLPKFKGHRVNFSDSSWESDRSKGSQHSGKEHDSSQSDNSRPNSPVQKGKSPRSSATEDFAIREARARIVQLVDKRVEAVSREIAPPAPRKPPFVAYTDAFLQILGANPTLEQILHDQRAPFFSGSGCFHRPTSTLFITSSFLPDPSPAAAPTRNYSITTTSISFFHGNEMTRDKVRFSENCMPGGACVWHPAAAPPSSRTFNTKQTEEFGKYSPATSPTLSSSLIVCAQGTLASPSGIMRVAPRRPHTVTPVLTTYAGGRPFNSPHSCVALSDGSILFTDPPIGYEVGFRPRPQLPPLVYRFDPATGDVRAIADGLARPTAIAVSPDERTVYVVDAPRATKIPGKGSHVEDVLLACTAPQPTVQAYTLVGVGQGAAGTGVFMTNRRLFAFPERCPTSVAVSARGDVFLACGSAGLLVFSKDGNLVGRIRLGEGENISGVCIGRKGELFCWGGHRVWRVGLEAGRLV